MTTETERPPLEPWQAADAQRLKQIWDERKPMSQQKFGLDYGIGTQGAVHQFLNGLRPLNLRVAVRFATGLGVRVADFSPTLAAEPPPSIDSPMEGLRRLIADLPAESGQQALDFIRYKFERAESVIGESKATSYMKMIDSIIRDLEERKRSDSKQ